MLDPLSMFLLVTQPDRDIPYTIILLRKITRVKNIIIRKFYKTIYHIIS